MMRMLFNPVVSRPGYNKAGGRESLWEALVGVVRHMGLFASVGLIGLVYKPFYNQNWFLNSVVKAD